MKYWDENADDFVFVSEGPLVLGGSAGAPVMNIGEIEGFRAQVSHGRRLLNLTVRPQVGTAETAVEMPGEPVFGRKDGRGRFVRHQAKSRGGA